MTVCLKDFLDVVFTDCMLVLLAFFEIFFKKIFYIQPKMIQTIFCQTRLYQVFQLVVVSPKQIAPHLQLFYPLEISFFGIVHEYHLKRFKA